MCLRAPPTRIRRCFFRRKIDRKSRSDRPKSVPKRRKNAKIRPLGAPGRSGTLRGRRGRRPRAVRNASGTARERSWPARAAPSRPKNVPRSVRAASAGHPDDARSQPTSVRIAKAMANSLSIEISSLLGRIERKPNLNFRQPVQCFVDFGRRPHGAPARSEKVTPGHHFRSQNRSRGPSGRLVRAPKRFLRAIKSARSTSGVTPKFLSRCERGKRAREERMLSEVECGGA